MANNYCKVLTHLMTPKHLLTQLAGVLAEVKTPIIKNFLIQQFIKQYDVNMQEAREENPVNYPCFNDFFIRHLKTEKRPLSKQDIVSPVDGIISQMGDIDQGLILQAKKRFYRVDEFLGVESAISDQFIHGKFMTLYLSPKDYHRIHMPLDGTLLNMTYVPGKLFSVQPATVNAIPKLFSRNERLIIFFQTSLGLMAMVLVGATIVGAIGTSWHGDIIRSKQPKYFNYLESNVNLKKGEELGYFKLGSTVVMLFANGTAMNWDSKVSKDLQVQYGQALGSFDRSKT